MHDRILMTHLPVRMSLYSWSPRFRLFAFSHVPNFYFFKVSEFSDQSLKLLLNRAARLLLNVSVQT